MTYGIIISDIFLISSLVWCATALDITTAAAWKTLKSSEGTLEDTSRLRFGFEVATREAAMRGFILKFLVQWLRDRHTSDTDIDRFVTGWRKLQDPDSLLCPTCFIEPKEKNKVQSLVEFSTFAGATLLYSVHCKT